MSDENNLKKLEDLIASLDLSDWAALPDVGLYMDQVTGLLNRKLSPFTMGRDEAPLTPNMINNYVKSRLIPRPAGKKYGREQIALLMMIVALKQACGMEDIRQMLTLEEGETVERAVADFISGMTDRYAIESYEEKFVPRVWRGLQE